MKLNINYGTDSIAKTYESAPTVSQVLGDANIKAVLGFGDNVKLLVNGVEQSSCASLDGVESVVIETKANSKASDIRVNISYGADSISKAFQSGSTIADIVNNPNIKAALGFGDNIKVLSCGVEQPLAAQLSDEDELVIETKANSKA
jgi:hypothetical protein